MSDIEAKPYADTLTPDAFKQEMEDAEAQGLYIVEADTNTLLLDLDGPDAHDQFRRLWPRTSEMFELAITERWPSKSGRADHEHLVITSDQALTATERLLLQACLGSDPFREMLSLVRIHLGTPEPSRLFKPEETA